MSLGTSEVREPSGPGVRTAGLAFVCALGVASVVSACSDDVGACCKVLDPSLVDRIPTSTATPAGSPSSDIALDPAFDCNSLICVAFRGSQAFCTARCFDDSDCPETFVCQSVLTANPGPDSEIQPGDRFCVREAHICTE